MTTPQECRRNGEDCLAMAEVIPELKVALNEIADAWFSLAAEQVVQGIFSKAILPRREP